MNLQISVGPTFLNSATAEKKLQQLALIEILTYVDSGG